MDAITIAICSVHAHGMQYVRERQLIPLREAIPLAEPCAQQALRHCAAGERRRTSSIAPSAHVVLATHAAAQGWGRIYLSIYLSIIYLGVREGKGKDCHAPPVE